MYNWCFRVDLAVTCLGLVACCKSVFQLLLRDHPPCKFTYLLTLGSYNLVEPGDQVSRWRRRRRRRRPWRSAARRTGSWTTAAYSTQRGRRRRRNSALDDARLIETDGAVRSCCGAFVSLARGACFLHWTVRVMMMITTGPINEFDFLWEQGRRISSKFQEEQ